MAVDSTGAKGQPQFDENAPIDDAAEKNALGDFSAKVGNRISDTAAARSNATTAGLVWEGLLWYETDTDLEFIYANGAWSKYPYLNTSETIGAFTAASGWAIDSQLAVKRAGEALVFIVFHRTGGSITVPSNGDVVNQTVATFRTGWTTAYNESLKSGGTGAMTQCLVAAGTGLVLAALANGGTTINSGDSFSANGRYLLA